MKSNTVTLMGKRIPEELRNIPSPPRRIFCRGGSLDDLLKRPRVAIVGSRGPSAYGKQVTIQFARDLAKQGVVIVSGLAFGVDALAHQTAIETGGLCIAVLPGPVGKIYPRSNEKLAIDIIKSGGVLLSEYDKGEISFKQNFIARNRLVSGLAQAVLITEAGKGSGSLHTARFARKQGKKVLAVPGNITSALSSGTNELLKTGATAVTCYEDVLKILGLRAHRTPNPHINGDSPQEQAIIDLLITGVSKGDQLLERSTLNTRDFNQALTMLEVAGKIRPLGNDQWSLL